MTSSNTLWKTVKLDGSMVKASRAKHVDSEAMVLVGATKRFYEDYGILVLRGLKEFKVSIFVLRVLREQGIEPSRIKAVKIMAYPFGASVNEVAYANYNGIDLEKTRYFGRYLPWLRRIEIYPPRFPFELTEALKAGRIWDDKRLRYFFFCFDPASTLLHEYLHVKYRSERTVKQLSKRHMSEFEIKMTGKVVYSLRRSMHPSLWVELYRMAREDVASQLHSK